MTARSQGNAAANKTQNTESRAQMGRAARVVSIVAGAVIIALAVVYCAGCIYFYQRFWPNTYIGDADVSSMTASEAQTALETASKARSVSVSGQGISFTLTGENAGLDLDAEAAVSKALASKASWLWPVEVLSEHDDSEVISTSFDDDLLRATIEAQLASFNSMASDPTDAFLYFDEATQSYQINPGSMGTKLDVESVMQSVKDALTNEQGHAPLTSANLVQQGVKSDDERLIAAQQTANSYLTCNVELVLEGTDIVVATLDASTIQAWVTVGEDYSVTLDDTQLAAWSSSIEDMVDSVGDARTYTRLDGRYVSVPANYSQGTYGWISDGAALLENIRMAVANGSVGQITVPVKQSAATYNPGGADWGNTYIDIDLGEQYVRYYSDGVLVWESACMSGLYGQHDTPEGVYYLNGNKRSGDIKLTAVDIDPTTGKPEYEVTVQYWMPFIGDLYALHDNPYRADDQSAYGGTWYYSEGSHGCVNLPSSKAQSLYGMVSVGTPVIVHY